MNPLKLLFVIGLGLVLHLLGPCQSEASIREDGTESNFYKEAVPISSTVAAQGDWNTQAGSFRGKNGQRFTLTFPAGAPTSRLWGTDLYTDDSSIATAAVHAGLITPQSGGTVTIEIRPAASSYKGSTRNGVTSKSYGSFGGSFVFVGQASGEVSTVSTTSPATVIPSAATLGDWNTQAGSFRGKNGQRFTFTFPAGAPTSRLWGTDLYTDDSSIASAAVHAGFITPQRGGTVTIEIRPAASSYKGSSRNGVTSKSYGSFGGSFVFVVQLVEEASTVSTTSPATVIPSSATRGNWNTQAGSFRGKNGQRFTFTFPAGAPTSRLWGTDLYTDDSSIATAAVHAGLITPQSGGTVTIEIRPAASSYKGSSRNGVVSKPYGSFGGSFVFVGQGAGEASTVSTTSPATVIPSSATRGDWNTQAGSFRGKNGQRFTFTFPAGAPTSRLWGTDLYTDDSSIATAAVHAGFITPQRGGTVTIEIRPAASSYKGSSRNGVVSKPYGSFGGSFVFVRGQ